MIINTKRLILRRWKYEDLDVFFGMYSLHEVVDGMGGIPARTKEEAQKALEYYIGSSTNYAICLSGSNLVIGGISFTTVDYDETIPLELQYEFGYSLHPDYWGLGFATEVSKAMAEYIKSELCGKCIWVRHFDFNVRSKKVIEKCGFLYQYSKTLTMKHLNNRIVERLYYRMDF